MNKASGLRLKELDDGIGQPPSAPTTTTTTKIVSRRPVVWHVAGEDAHVRIPSLLALRKLGYDVGVCGWCDEQPFLDANIPFYQYPVRRFLSPLSDKKSIQTLTELMRQHQPDIVHGFSTKPSLFSPQAAAKAGVRVNVRTVTGMGYLFSDRNLKTKLLRPIYRALQRRVARLTDSTVFQNSDDRGYFIDRGLVDAKKATLIPGSGVDPERFLESYESKSKIHDVREELGLQDKKVVLMVTRMVRSKGVNDFLSAALMFQKQHQQENVQFVLIGPLATEGSQAVPLSEIEAASSAVRYLGRREDIVTFMQMADVFVLPTLYREGIPRVLLEAASAQTPIVTTDMPGCREVVTHGDTGLLVPRKNPEAIASAVNSLLSDESLRRKVMEGALSRVHQQFAFEHVVSKYDELYRGLLQQKKVPAWPSQH